MVGSFKKVRTIIWLEKLKTFCFIMDALLVILLVIIYCFVFYSWRIYASLENKNHLLVGIGPSSFISKNPAFLWYLANSKSSLRINWAKLRENSAIYDFFSDVSLKRLFLIQYFVLHHTSFVVKLAKFY